MKQIIVLLILLIIILLYKNKQILKEKFNYKLIPNSSNSSVYIDDGILRNTRKNQKFYSIKNEFMYNQFKSILDNIVQNNPHKNLQFFPKYLKLPNVVLNILLSKINYYSKLSESNKNMFIPFKIFESKLINTYSSKININKYHFYTKLYRKDKDHYFSLFIEVLEKGNNRSYLFTKINIEGILTEDSLDSKKIYSYNNIKYDSIDDSYNFKIPNNFIPNKNYKNKDYNERSDYKCFLKKSRTKFDCLSPDPNGLVGVWDKPCVSNFECPFYKKNKNYPNTRGGCINGKCELPIGCERVGYSYYALKPLCHNCKKTNCKGVDCNRCCDDKNDYAFENDFTNRYLYRDLLEQKKLPIYGLNL